MDTRVLVINDEPDLLEACAMILESEGYVVETLARGSESAQRVTHFRPDLVLLDWVMSDTTGDVVLSELRTQFGANLPIVVMSALPGLRSLALELGADDFMQKPFDDVRLLSIVAQNLRNGSSRGATRATS